MGERLEMVPMLAEKVNDAFLRKELGFGLVSISHPSKGTVITLLG